MFDKTINGINTALNFRLLKQNVHASNIANANTPEYKAMKIDFDRALHDAIDPHSSQTLKTSNPMHFESSSIPPDIKNPDIHENPDTVINESGNSVSVDHEMAELAQNRILYNAAVNMIKKKFGLLKYALQDTQA